MSDAPTKAEQFRARTKECLRIAYFATDAKQKTEYRRMASHYRELAEAEESLAGLAPRTATKQRNGIGRPQWPAKDAGPRPLIFPADLGGA